MAASSDSKRAIGIEQPHSATAAERGCFKPATRTDFRSYVHCAAPLLFHVLLVLHTHVMPCAGPSPWGEYPMEPAQSCEHSSTLQEPDRLFGMEQT